MKTKEELLKIYSAYLPYELKGKTIYDKSDDLKNELCTLSTKDDLNNVVGIDDWVNQYSYPIKPILYSMDMLTKEELYDAGFEDHVDWLTNERNTWIKKYGFEGYLNETPYGHIQYLISRHYNIFGLDESEYIKKESLK